MEVLSQQLALNPLPTLNDRSIGHSPLIPDSLC